jgi:hypothetical protein
VREAGKPQNSQRPTAAAAELQTQVMDWGGCFFQTTQDSNPRPCQLKSQRGTDLNIYLFIYFSVKWRISVLFLWQNFVTWRFFFQENEKIK